MRFERVRRAPFWPLPIALASLCLLQIYAFHWGVITPDTVVQYGQALSGRYDDWHPPIMAWIWRQLLPIHRGSPPFLILDSLLYWIGIGALADAFRRRGQPLAMWGVVLCGALPIPFGQVGSILKDALLAACCLAATGIAAHYRLTGRRPSPWAVTLAALLLAIAGASRLNALLAVVPLFLLLVPAGFVFGGRRILLSACGAAALLGGFGYCVNSIALRPTSSQPIFSLVNFDLAGVIAHGGRSAYPNLGPEAAAALTARCYSAALYDPHDTDECEAVGDDLAAFSRREGPGPVAIWLRGVSAGPLAYARHRFAHVNRNWRWLVPAVPDDAVYVMSADNDLGLGFTANGATRIVYRAATVMALSPLGRPATWLAVALGLLILAPRLGSRRVVACLAASALCYGGAYMLVSVAPDLRYNLWTMLAAMLAAICAFSDVRLRAVSGARWIAAAIPTALVVTSELVWLGFGLPAPI